MSDTLSEGQKIHFIKGDLTGSTGTIARYYNGPDMYSVRILPVDCTDRTIPPAPDGLIHWIAYPHEIEAVGKTLRFT